MLNTFPIEREPRNRLSLFAEPRESQDWKRAEAVPLCWGAVFRARQRIRHGRAMVRPHKKPRARLFGKTGLALYSWLTFPDTTKREQCRNGCSNDEGCLIMISDYQEVRSYSKEMLREAMYQGAEFFFWDRRRQSVGQLFVTHVYWDHFTFRYRQKNYSCSFERAAYKLYDCFDDALPVGRRIDKENRQKEIDAQKELASSKSRQERLNQYTPSSDVMVEFGD